MARTPTKEKARKAARDGGKRGNIKRAGRDIYEDERRQRLQRVKPAGRKDLLWFETRWKQYQRNKTI